MQPDYPHKLFSDKRNNYSLLMLALAMDSVDAVINAGQFSILY